MMTLICHSGRGREEIEATPTWLSSTFSSRQIIRLRKGKTVFKGMRGPITERRVYWKPSKSQTRRRSR
jgi:hypothetical protein